MLEGLVYDVEPHEALDVDDLPADLTGIPPPPVEVPTWDTDDDSWVDELAAADPDRPRTAREVLSEAEAVAVSAWTVMDLAAIDVRTLDDDGLIGLAVVAQRLENYAASIKVEAVAAFAGKTFRHWTVSANQDNSWTWTSSRTGRCYRTEPHDYRLGP